MYLAKRYARRRTVRANRNERDRIERAGTDLERRQLKVRQACDLAALGYLERPVNVPVFLIRSSQFVNLSEKDAHVERWKRLAQSGLDIVEVDANHRTMLTEPEVAGVAQAISHYLAASAVGPT